MANPVKIVNDGFDTWSSEAGKWYTNANADREERQASTLLLTIAFGLQLAIYYKLWDAATDARDALIDRQKGVLDYIHRTDIDIDFPMLKKKQEVLDVPLPPSTKCSDALKHVIPVLAVGESVDAKASAEGSFGANGIPTGWVQKSIGVMAMKAASYGGSNLSASGKRRIERFRDEKTSLVLHSQGATEWNITPALHNYTQAISIHEGLAQIFAGGFNSAGVGLGTVWGRAATQSAGGRA